MMHLLGQMPGIYVQAGPRTQTWANRACLDYAFMKRSGLPFPDIMKRSGLPFPNIMERSILPFPIIMERSGLPSPRSNQ